MKKVYNIIWKRTTWDRRIQFEDSCNSKVLDDVLGVVSKFVEIAEVVGSKLATLGFVEAKTAYKGMEFVVGADAMLLSKPDFDLLNDNKVKISKMNTFVLFKFKIYLEVEATLKVDTSGWFPDFLTPWEDDITVHKERYKIKIFDITLPFPNMNIKKGVGKIVLDQETQSLKIDVESIDLYWDFISFTDCPFLNFPEWLINKVIDLFEGKIADSIPTITVSPSFKFNVSDLPTVEINNDYALDFSKINWKMNITGNSLEVSNSEAVLAADLNFDELKKDVPYVPKYIVNTNNREVHKIGCDSLLDTYEEHQRGYHLLNDAINRDIDGCKKCLPAFHKR